MSDRETVAGIAKARRHALVGEVTHRGGIVGENDPHAKSSRPALSSNGPHWRLWEQRRE